MARRHVAIADRLEQRGREPWNISTRVNMKRARPRNVSRTLYNYTGRGLPSRATPDTPPLAAAMLRFFKNNNKNDTFCLLHIFARKMQNVRNIVKKRRQRSAVDSAVQEVGVFGQRRIKVERFLTTPYQS